MCKIKRAPRSLCPIIFPMIFIFCFIYIIGCSGGDGDENPVNSTIVSGTAAAGSPIVGMVYIKGVNGNTVSSSIGSDGSYSIDTYALTAPFILYAEGSVNGKIILIYAACFATGTVNITPVTDFILRKAFGNDLNNVYTNWETLQVASADLETAETNVQNQFDPLLSGAGLPPDVDLLSTPFQADFTGMDIVLEAIDIGYQGTVATVTNNFTGSQYFDDVADPSDDNTGLPISDEQDSQDAISDNAAINQVWDILENLFATSVPTAAEINTQFGPYIANDFLGQGDNKTEELADIADSDSSDVGETFSAVITAPMDVSGTGYQKGYQVRIHLTSIYDEEFHSTWMVYDGTDWLWYGNQEWLEHYLTPAARITIDQNDKITFETGFSFFIDDQNDYAYNNGVRSAIITGNGLPTAGVVMQHDGPGTRFSIYQGQGSHYFITDDNIISGIPDGSLYTVRFYAETADVVSLLNDTPLETYTTLHGKRPLSKSELNASMFPTLTAPTSHGLSATNIPGVLNVTWTNPSNMSVFYTNLGWNDGVGYNQLREDIIPGDTSVVFDSTDMPTVVNYARIYMDGIDIYERFFELLWEFGN